MLPHFLYLLTIFSLILTPLNTIATAQRLAADEEVHLQVRLPSGQQKRVSYQAKTTLARVLDDVRTTAGVNIQLLQTHPRHVFQVEELEKSLAELGFGRRCLLIAEPVKPTHSESPTGHPAARNRPAESQAEPRASAVPRESQSRRRNRRPRRRRLGDNAAEDPDRPARQLQEGEIPVSSRRLELPLPPMELEGDLMDRDMMDEDEEEDDFDLRMGIGPGIPGPPARRPSRRWQRGDRKSVV